jgi:hypothetical protein
MSVLAMILTAAMVVPGDGPEKVSGEVSEKGQGLDLKGKCKGSFRTKLHDTSFSTVPATYQDGKLAVMYPGGPEMANVVFIDEGNGKCRCHMVEENLDALGIYKWKRGQLCICFNADCKNRPTSFTVDRVHSLLILHRVTPSK